MSMMNYAPVSVTLVPATPAELLQPFQLGAGGVLALTYDPIRQAIAHILEVAFTLPTERVMHPGIGAGVQAMLFSNSPLGVFQQIAADMQTMFAQLEGTTFVTDVKVTTNPTNASEYLFAVEFALDMDATVHQALFNYAGTIVGTS